jgi:hypothetical protein
MVKLYTFLAFTLCLISCGNYQKITLNEKELNPFTSGLTDSTKVEGYNASQRAFAWYLMSLPSNELKKWQSQGAFTTEEKDNFLHKIDSMQLDIVLPDSNFQKNRN